MRWFNATKGYGFIQPDTGGKDVLRASLAPRYSKMSKETPKDRSTPTVRPQGSHRQTDKPWKGNPEKEQRNDGAKIDLEKWHETNTH